MYDLLFGNDVMLFSIPALVGTIFFVVRIGLSLVTGGLIDGEMDTSLDDGLDALDEGAGVEGTEGFDGEDAAHSDSNTVFKFLSIQTITAFAMGFGWVGLIGLKTFHLGVLESAFIGLAGGIGFVWFLLWLLRLVYSLQSSGNLTVRDAVGLEGEVYTDIPGENEGSGRVRVVIDDRQRVYRARTRGDRLPTRTRVRVVRASSDNTIEVEALVGA